MGIRHGYIFKGTFISGMEDIIDKLRKDMSLSEIVDESPTLGQETLGKWLKSLSHSGVEGIFQGTNSCATMSEYLPSQSTMEGGTFTGIGSRKYLDAGTISLVLDTICSDFFFILIEDGAEFADGQVHMSRRWPTQHELSFDGFSFNQGVVHFDWMNAEDVDSELFTFEGQDLANKAVRSHKVRGSLLATPSLTHDMWLTVLDVHSSEDYLPSETFYKWNTPHERYSLQGALSKEEKEKRRGITLSQGEDMPSGALERLIRDAHKNFPEIPASDLLCSFDVRRDSSDIAGAYQAGHAETLKRLLRSELGNFPVLPETPLSKPPSHDTHRVVGIAPSHSAKTSITRSALWQAALMASTPAVYPDDSHLHFGDSPMDFDLASYSPMVSRPVFVNENLKDECWKTEKQKRNDAYGFDVNNEKRSRSAILKQRKQKKKARKNNRK